MPASQTPVNRVRERSGRRTVPYGMVGVSRVRGVPRDESGGQPVGRPVRLAAGRNRALDGAGGEGCSSPWLRSPGGVRLAGRGRVDGPRRPVRGDGGRGDASDAAAAMLPSNGAHDARRAALRRDRLRRRRLRLSQRRISGAGDLRRRRQRDRRRGREGRRRERRLGGRAGRHAPAEGRRRAEHHQPRLSGLPQRRELHRCAPRRSSARCSSSARRPSRDRSGRPSRRRCRSSRAGQPGAGEHYLPVSQHVEPGRPRPHRRRRPSCPTRSGCRIIINELGAGLAGNGTALTQVVERADPALAAIDKVLGDPRVGEPHARAAGHRLRRGRSPRWPATAAQLADFISQSNTVATVQRRAPRRRSASRCTSCPGFLDQLTPTLRELARCPTRPTRCWSTWPRRRRTSTAARHAPHAVLAGRDHVPDEPRTDRGEGSRADPGGRAGGRRSSARSGRPPSRSRRTPRRCCSGAAEAGRAATTSWSSSSAPRWPATATTRSDISCATSLVIAAPCINYQVTATPAVQRQLPGQHPEQLGGTAGRRGRRSSPRHPSGPAADPGRAPRAAPPPPDATTQHPAQLPARRADPMSTTAAPARPSRPPARPPRPPADGGSGGRPRRRGSGRPRRGVVLARARPRGPHRRLPRARRQRRRRPTTCCSPTPGSWSRATRSRSGAFRRVDHRHRADEQQPGRGHHQGQRRRSRRCTQGTTAQIRSPSLSGVANRYIALDARSEQRAHAARRRDAADDRDHRHRRPRPDLRHARPATRKGAAGDHRRLGDLLRRSLASRSTRRSPTSRRRCPRPITCCSELDLDQAAFTNFIVATSNTVTAIAARAPQLSALVQNADQTFGAIGAQNAGARRPGCGSCRPP